MKMNKFLLLIPLLLSTGINFAYAEPLDEVMTEIVEFNDNFVTIKISWNQDDTVFQYEIGCVSCSPNISEITTENGIILNNITSIGDESMALLYVIAYDSNDKIINVEQVFVEFN
jgi:hypothetical protein